MTDSAKITAKWKACQEQGGCVSSGRYSVPRLVRIQQRSRYIVEDHRRMPICKRCGVPMPEGPLK